MSVELVKELRQRTGAGMMDCKKALQESDNNIEKAIDWLRTNGISKASKKSGRIAAEGSIFVANNDEKAVMIEINTETDYVSSNEMFIKESNRIVEAILNSDVKTNEEVLSLVIDKETVDSIIINMTATIGEKISFRRFIVVEGNLAVYKHANARIGTIVTGKDISKEILKDVSMHVAAMAPEFLSKDEISKETIDKETMLANEELVDALKGKPENIQEKIIKGKVDKTLSESVLLEQTFVKDSNKKIKDLSGSGKFTSFVRFEVGEGIEKKIENFADEVAKQMA